jgi:hypothetical protein
MHLSLFFPAENVKQHFPYPGAVPRFFFTFLFLFLYVFIFQRPHGTHSSSGPTLGLVDRAVQAPGETKTH